MRSSGQQFVILFFWKWQHELMRGHTFFSSCIFFLFLLREKKTSPFFSWFVNSSSFLVPPSYFFSFFSVSPLLLLPARKNGSRRRRRRRSEKERGKFAAKCVSLSFQKWEDGMCAISFLRSARLPNSRHCSSQDLPHNFCHKGLCTNVPLVQKEKKMTEDHIYDTFFPTPPLQDVAKNTKLR